LHKALRICLLCVMAWSGSAVCADDVFVEAVPFAVDGPLKMLYDNRMHPQALAYQGKVYIVWRGDKGMPYIRSYDLDTRKFSEPVMMLAGMEDKIDVGRYARDHHFSPVIWMDGNARFHVLSGCHGNRPSNFTGGNRIRSKLPGEITEWEWVDSQINVSVNYPKPYRIYDDQTLVFFRNGGHLDEWTYRISADDGETWTGPERAVVDLDGIPQDGVLADHAGSYCSVRVSKDGKTLHVAFIWAQQDYEPDETPPVNPRYGDKVRFRRYNLYYIKVDLPTGRVFNRADKEVETPVRKSIADADCLVWDTDWRISAVTPSICLDENGQPAFLLAVSADTPYRCTFYFVTYETGVWRKTAVTQTSHPWNTGHLERGPDGTFRAYMIVGEGENVSNESKQDMNRYGWGDRIELWTSDKKGKHWKLAKDITPVPEHRWQNVKFVSRDTGDIVPGMILFYGWQGVDGKGTAYLWDNRK